MTAILIASFILFAAYIATIIAANHGIPASVSDSFYILDGQRKDLGYVFTPWCWAIGGSVMLVMFEISEGEWYQALGLFAGGGLCFAGTAPLFKGHERLIHYTSAAVCALSATLWIIFTGYWTIPLAFALIATPVIQKYGNPVFWAETALFLATYLSLYIHLNQI
jgi:hypothetical protein